MKWCKLHKRFKNDSIIIQVEGEGMCVATGYKRGQHKDAFAKNILDIISTKEISRIKQKSLADRYKNDYDYDRDWKEYN